MKKIIFMLILINLTAFNAVYVFSQTVNNAYLDTSSPKYEELLFFLDKNNLQVYFSGRYSNPEIELRASRDFIVKAIDLYNQKNYEASIDNLILARKAYPYNYGLFFYYLGLCLMDINSLELAKRSFEHAIEFFFNRKMHVGVNNSFEDLFSYDDNHVKREPYFAYYNIACIESLRKNTDSAFKNLSEALYHGYPYIDHIKKDTDLRNLFAVRGRLQEIEAIFNAGSRNNLVGKYFDLDVDGYMQYIYFKDRRTMEVRIEHQDGMFYKTEAYEIKNYTVFSKAFTQTYVRRFEGLDVHGMNYEEIYSSEFR
jgi:hypothetical protein